VVARPAVFCIIAWKRQVHALASMAVTPKFDTARSASKPPFKRQLQDFGAEIERLRRTKGPLTQGELATKLTRWLHEQGLVGAKEKIHQSHVARLEKGVVPDPDPELLRALGEVLDVKFERLVGLLVKDKYEIANEKIWPLMNDPLTLDELAAWEQQYEELWIVAIKYVDDTQTRFRSAIENILQKPNGRVTFFLPATQLPLFELYREEVLEAVQKEDQEILHAVPLNDRQQVPLLVNSYVIGNPGSARSVDDPMSDPMEGYLILNNENYSPYLGLRMPADQVRDLSVRLARLRSREHPLNTQDKLTAQTPSQRNPIAPSVRRSS